MCGIVGYISTDDKYAVMAKEHFMQYALMLDTLRGRDSTGLILVRNNFDVHTAHTTAAGMEYVHSDHYKDVVKEPSWAAVGHNRAATAGSVKLENAHPFTFGDVTMVHNGTLTRGGRGMPGYDPKLEVDSMQIALALSKADPEDVSHVLETVDGSFCLVWVDQRNDTINMARNSERPMHFCFNTSKEIMWFMSDGNHLHTINESLKRSPTYGQTVYTLDKMKWLQWKKGSLIPKVREFKLYKPPAPVYTGQQAYNQRWWGGRDTFESAQSRAADKWRQGIRARTLQEERLGKVVIAGERRKIPEVQGDLLEKFYEVECDTLLEMEVDTWTELAGKRCIVEGFANHPEWEQDIPVILFDVPLVCCTSYYTRPWAVRPKGLTIPMDWDNTQGEPVPSILAELYSTDAPAVMPDAETAEEEEKRELDSGLVVGPEERLMSYGRLMQDLQAGCVQCGEVLKWEDRRDYMYVNENRDLLCKGCVDDWEAQTA